MDGELELVEVAADDGQRFGFGSRGRPAAGEWTREDEEMRVGYAVPEEDEYEEMRKEGAGMDETWDGMDMDMDMD